MPKRGSYFSRERELERMEKLQQKKEKRRRKVIRASQEPLLPTVIHGLFIGMLLLVPATLAVEIIVTLEGKRNGGFREFFCRSGWSLLCVWLIFGALVLFLCSVQLIRIYYFGYEEKCYRFADEIPDREFFLYTRVYEPEGTQEEELALYAGPGKKPAESKYLKMVRITVLVGVAAAAYYGIGAAFF